MLFPGGLGDPINCFGEVPVWKRGRAEQTLTDAHMPSWCMLEDGGNSWLLHTMVGTAYLARDIPSINEPSPLSRYL